MDRFTFFTILFICCGAIGIQAQLCIPEPVEIVELSPNGTLSWSASENCEQTLYTILIQTGGVIEYEYTVDSLSLNLSFLKLCRLYTFTVTPNADHILGGDTSIDSAIPLPDDLNINVLNFTGSQIGEDVLVQWQINENYTYCVTYYHLLTWDEESSDPESLYIGQTGHMLEHVAQCMNYQFQITVYYGNRNGSAEKFNYTVPEETNIPSLIQLRQDTTVINSTWRLESFRLNRCNVTALYINSTHFNQVYDIVDEPDRPDVEVSITDLRANTMYYFNVSTENSAGISNPFQIAVQTLPEEDFFL